MNLKDKSVLITGGASGIGLEAARQFLAFGARVTITGRTQSKLDQAKERYPALTVIKSDVASKEDSWKLFTQMKEAGGIDILYNNAGVLTEPSNLGLASNQHIVQAEYEMNVNYLSVIHLNNLFMNMLKSRKESAIINTTSILSYVPSLGEATYSASKVALRFYTEALRKHLELIQSPVKVFELLPPVVATEMTAAREGKKMTSEALVNALISALLNDQYTIRVGDTKAIYLLSRLFPKTAFGLVNPKKSNQLLIP